MPQTATSQNPNDFKVVKVTNKTDFDFTPDMGCMYDGRPVFGIQGALGIAAGESMILPYHVAHRLAVNLAKIVQIRKAPIVDEANNPVGRPLWSSEELDRLKNLFIEELYSETRPIMQTETDRLMAKVDEYRKMVEDLVASGRPLPTSKPQEAITAAIQTSAPVQESAPSAPAPLENTSAAQQMAPALTVFQDKQEVIAELEKRQIKHDKRMSKAGLEALLTVKPQ